MQNQHTHKKDIQEKSGQDLRQSKREQNLAEQPHNLTQETQNTQAQYNLFNQIETQQREHTQNKEQDSMPICVECPKAMWHIASKAQERTIRCFCQIMHSITYQALWQAKPTQETQEQTQERKQENLKSEILIEHCDGQLAALQELVDNW